MYRQALSFVCLWGMMSLALSIDTILTVFNCYLIKLSNKAFTKISVRIYLMQWQLTQIV